MKTYKEIFLSIVELEEQDVLTVSLEPGETQGEYEGEFGDNW